MPVIMCGDQKREIRRLKGLGRGCPKRIRRLIGRAIRRQQKRLSLGRRSVSIGFDFGPPANRIWLDEHTYMTVEAFERAWLEFSRDGLEVLTTRTPEGFFSNTFLPPKH